MRFNVYVLGKSSNLAVICRTNLQIKAAFAAGQRAYGSRRIVQ
jgi:hypothetical protein